MQIEPNPNTRFYPFLKAHSEQFRQKLMHCAVATRHLIKGSALLTQGQVVDHLYLVPHGRVSMNITVASGKRFQLGEVQCTEQIFGEMEFLNQNLCQWSVVAEQDIDVTAISVAKLTRSLQAHPEMAMFFASALADDYQDSMDIYTQRLLRPIVYNIAYDLWIRDSNTVVLGGFAKIDPEAERFGTISRVYRRAVKELVVRGLVRKQGAHLEILDRQGLKAFLDDSRHNDL